MPSLGYGQTEAAFGTDGGAKSGTSAAHQGSGYSAKDRAPRADCVAGRPGTGQRWYRRRVGHQRGYGGAVAAAVYGFGAGWIGGSPPAGAARPAGCGKGPAGAERSGATAEKLRALVVPAHGAACGPLQGRSATPVGRQRPQTALHPHFQTLQRSAIRVEVLGCHRLLPGSARAVGGAML